MLGLGFAPQIDALKALLLPPAGAGEGKQTGKKALPRVQVRGETAGEGAGGCAAAAASKLASMLSRHSRHPRRRTAGVPLTVAVPSPSPSPSPARQVGLFTATMPDALADVAAGWLHKPERVRVSPSAASIAGTVTQVVQVCAEHKKPAKLVRGAQ